MSDLDYYGERLEGRSSARSFYHFTMLPNFRLGISIGQITGEDASPVMEGLQASARSLAAAQTGDAAIAIRALNRVLWELSPEYYATLFCGHIDPIRRQMSFVNAGHEPVLLIRRDGASVQRLENSGTLLGLSRHSQFTAHSVTLHPGDTLAALSGVGCDTSEACALGALRRHPDVPCSELAHYIMDAVGTCTPYAATEDRTVVVVRLCGAKTTGSSWRPLAGAALARAA
jgi:hypothetical protein